MKRIDCIWVLALAGTVMACNSGSPITGCTVDLVTGKCEGRDVPPEPGPSPGTGGTGGTVVEPGAFTNRNTCINNVEEGCIDPDTCNCDYGCVAVGNTFGFEAILNVIPDEAFVGGGEFDVEFDGEFTVSEAFIAGAEIALGFDLNTAAIGAVPNSLPVTALSGATGVDTVVTLTPADPQPPFQTCQSLPAPGCLDLDLDPGGNGTPGPFPLPFVRTTGTYTFGLSGTQACFNFTNAVGFNMTITEANRAPFFFPADFACQPVDQEGINLTNIDCTSDDDCAAFGTTCNVPQLSCTAVVTPQPAAGQVCFEIP